MARPDYYLKIDTIDGESTKTGVEGQIELLSWSWGETNSGSMAHGTGGGEGKATFHDLSFIHRYDKSSPVLMQYCATGVHLKEATITNRKAGKGQQEYLVIKMNDVIVTGVTHGNSGSDGATENVSVAFAKVAVEYKPQKPDGSLDAGVHFKYDLKAQKEA